MKIYVVQLEIVWREKQANYAKVEELLNASKVEPGSFIILPEMFATGFDVVAEGVAEGSGDGLVETAAYLSTLAQKWKSTVLGSGIAYAPSGKRQNLVVAYNDKGERIASYQKMYPFTYGGEHKRFEAGEEIVTFQAGAFLVSPFICYDLRFPEVFRHAVLRGSQILTVSANWPSARHEHWLALLRARAIENQCFVIGANRSGCDRFMKYLGESVIYSPQGEVLAQATEEECVLSVDLDLDALQQWRKDFPVLKDIRGNWLGLA